MREGTLTSFLQAAKTHYLTGLGSSICDLLQDLRCPAGRNVLNGWCRILSAHGFIELASRAFYTSEAACGGAPQPPAQFKLIGGRNRHYRLHKS